MEVDVLVPDVVVVDVLCVCYGYPSSRAMGEMTNSTQLVLL